MALNDYIAVCVKDDTGEIITYRPVPAEKPWPSFRCGKTYTSYHTPEELGIDTESVDRHKGIMKELETLASDLGSYHKREALYKQSAPIKQTWNLAAYRWLAWKRRRAAVMAWNLAHE
jgi:hypothetical protein